jgi:hypothetical protein
MRTVRVLSRCGVEASIVVAVSAVLESAYMSGKAVELGLYSCIIYLFGRALPCKLAGAESPAPDATCKPVEIFTNSTCHDGVDRKKKLYLHNATCTVLYCTVLYCTVLYL